MAQPQNYLDKVRKLLAKAESPATGHEEREALTRAASRLMVKYGIDAAALAAADSKYAADDPIEYVIVPVTGVGPKRYGREWVTMGIAVAEALGAKALYVGLSSGSVRLGIAGHRSDIERISMLWRSLQFQATSEMARFVAGYPSWNLYTSNDKYQIKRSFIVGYGREVGARLRALRRETIAEAKVDATPGTPGTDLVRVMADREQEIQDWIDAGNVRITGQARNRRYTPSGAIAGHVAGARADIGQTKLDDEARRVPVLRG